MVYKFIIENIEKIIQGNYNDCTVTGEQIVNIYGEDEGIITPFNKEYDVSEYGKKLNKYSCYGISDCNLAYTTVVEYEIENLEKFIKDFKKELEKINLGIKQIEEEIQKDLFVKLTLKGEIGFYVLSIEGTDEYSEKEYIEYIVFV